MSSLLKTRGKLRKGLWESNREKQSQLIEELSVLENLICDRIIILSKQNEKFISIFEGINSLLQELSSDFI